MFTLAVFIISLVLLVILFAAKALEIYYGRKIFLEDFFLRCDVWVSKALHRIKFWWSHINFKNTKRIVAWVAVTIKGSAVAFKRHFDHEQSHFFTKHEPDLPKSRKPASFFLKDVSDYKKKLREENGHSQ